MPHSKPSQQSCCLQAVLSVVLLSPHLCIGFLQSSPKPGKRARSCHVAFVSYVSKGGGQGGSTPLWWAKLGTPLWGMKTTPPPKDKNDPPGTFQAKSLKWLKFFPKISPAAAIFTITVLFFFPSIVNYKIFCLRQLIFQMHSCSIVKTTYETLPFQQQLF